MKSRETSSHYIDCHLHFIGNGSSGKGSRLRLRNWYHKILAQHILKTLKLPRTALLENLDELYLSAIIRMLRESSLSQAVLLGMDYPRDEQGKVLDSVWSFYVPNEQVLEIAKNHCEFLPGVSIHPARTDALDELEKCLSGGAALMKCLPNCHNIDCNDSRYDKFWERMAEAGLPLLVHTGGELSVPVVNHKFADPRTMIRPLEIGVTVIMAHSGTNSLLFDPSYVETFGELLTRFPNLYGDNSALNTPLRSQHFSKLLRAPFKGRVIYGSDLPIPVSPWWPLLRRLISFSDFSRIRALDSPLEMDFQIKRAMGFEEESFTLLSKLLRLPSKF